MDGIKELAQQLVDLGAAAGKHVSTPDGGTAMVVPANFKVQTFPPVTPAEPELKRINGGAQLHDVDSFVAYVNRYKGSATRIFAEPGFLASGGARIVAVMDFHEPNDQPRHCAHIASYTPRYSDPWARWMKASVFEQVPFAEFIEENRSEISEPPAAGLLDVVRTFKAFKKIDFDSVVYQSNGDVRLGYSEQSEAKGSTPSSVLPERLTLGIPVYFRGRLYAVGIWVRYRVANGKVVFTLKVDRPDVIEDDAFRELTEKVATDTGIEVYLGRRT